MSETIVDNVTTLLETGAAQAKPINFGAAQPFSIIPSGYQVADLEKMLEKPVRKRGNVTTTDTTSFVTYIKKHGSLDD